MIFKDKGVIDFTAGAMKYSPGDQPKYIPLFPYFYCQDVQKKQSVEAASDSDSQEHDGSLSSLKYEEVAPPDDVVPYFFGSR